MSSLVQAPALFLSIQFLIISASYKKHICLLKGNMVTKRSFLYSFSLTWTLGFNWRIKCIMYDTFHNYCWWFCEKEVGRWFGTEFPDWSQTWWPWASHIASLCLHFFICKMGIIILVIPHLNSTLKDQSKKREKKSIRCIDPNDGQNIDVAVIK